MKRFSLIGAAALVLFSAMVTSQLTTPTAANAVAPPAPVAEFNAPLCEGETTYDPKDADGAVPDLTRVFGQRLTDYNNGQVAVLYNNRGANASGSVPACGTRYVDGIGAVSEWMFCTDYDAHTCTETDEDGNLLDEDGNLIGGKIPVASNPDLTPDEEKIIAYLIQHGHKYIEKGNTLPDASIATSDTRLELQNLIWCVSDSPNWAVCNDNMNEAEKARILTLIPDEPTIELSLSETDDDDETLAVGDTAKFSLSTNLYEQAITLELSGVAGTLAVISGPATLNGTTLTVQGNDPTVMTDVVLGFTATAAGAVSIDAQATPASTTHISWNQSPGVADDGVPCQVFATFNEVDQVTVEASATATFAEGNTEEPGTGDPGEEPGTGEPGTENPGTENPGTENPGTGEPGTEEPGTDAPGTNAPGTNEPSNETPDSTDSNEAPNTADGSQPGQSDETNTGAKLAVTGGSIAPLAIGAGALLLLGAGLLLAKRRGRAEA